MPLFRPHHRFNAGSHVADQADLQGGLVAEVFNDPSDRASIGGVHIRQPCEAERSVAEDGVEDRGSLADGSGQISIIGGTDLHESGSIAWIRTRSRTISESEWMPITTQWSAGWTSSLPPMCCCAWRWRSPYRTSRTYYGSFGYIISSQYSHHRSGRVGGTRTALTASYPTHLPELGEDRTDPQGPVRVNQTKIFYALES